MASNNELLNRSMDDMNRWHIPNNNNNSFVSNNSMLNQSFTGVVGGGVGGGQYGMFDEYSGN